MRAIQPEEFQSAAKEALKIYGVDHGATNYSGNLKETRNNAETYLNCMAGSMLILEPALLMVNAEIIKSTLFVAIMLGYVIGQKHTKEDPSVAELTKLYNTPTPEDK